MPDMTNTDMHEHEYLGQIRSNIFDTVRKNRTLSLIESIKYDDEGRIHCNNGPAVTFHDNPHGKGIWINVKGLQIKHLWVIHGMLVHSLSDFVLLSDAPEKERFVLKLKHTEDDFGVFK